MLWVPFAATMIAETIRKTDRLPPHPVAPKPLVIETVDLPITVTDTLPTPGNDQRTDRKAVKR